MQVVQTNLRDNPYLQPMTKSDEEMKKEEQAANRVEYEKRVGELEDLMKQLQQQSEKGGDHR